MRVYLVILSDQLLPNLIPILANPPDLVIALVSEEMQRNGKERVFTSILQQKDIPVRALTGVPISGYPDILQYAQRISQDLRRDHPEVEVVLNITGGPKLTVVALVDAFRPIARRLEYTDTIRHVLEIIPTDALETARSEALGQVLDVPIYLAAQGFHVHSILSDQPGWEQAAEQRKSAAFYLANRAMNLSTFFGIMNALASKALSPHGGKFLVEPMQTLDASKPPPKGLWRKTLERLDAAGVLHWSVEAPYTLAFPDAESARFLNGGWLEEYVWHVLREQGLHDVRLGVDGLWEGQGDAPNEFDVLATENNTMLYVECKTSAYKEDKDNHLSYKTGSLGPSVRGSLGQTWVVSARKPTGSLLRRAQQFQFRVITPEEIPHLGALVRSWAEGRP